VKVRITYYAEWTSEGWILMRRIEGKDPEAVNPFSTRKPQIYQTSTHLRSSVASQTKADQAAATRLGVQLEVSVGSMPP
jgi:hypothetical protein